MYFFFFLFISIPVIVLLFKFDARQEIAAQYVIVMLSLIAGWKLLGTKGCVKFVGLLLLILALAGYYYFLISPFFKGYIIQFIFR